jgi:hypothetical protein
MPESTAANVSGYFSKIINMRRIKLLIILGFALLFIAVRFASTPAVSGQANIAQPTGVSATLNLYNNKIGVYWDTMRGATAYRVYRNTTNDPATATLLTTTPLPFKPISSGFRRRMAVLRVRLVRQFRAPGPRRPSKVHWRHCRLRFWVRPRIR